MTGIQILGTGSYVPDNIVRNEDLAELGFDADWIIQRTGIEQRRHARPEMATSDVAFEAAQKCLEDADVSPDQLDMILLATMTPDHFAPSTACLVQDKLGATAPAMDLNAACSGFIYALVTGSQFLLSGTFNRVLVIGAELMSRICNPEDQKTYPLFGDGAGAVLLSNLDSDGNDSNSASGILSFNLGADGSGGELLCVPGGGTRKPLSSEVLNSKEQFLSMEGRAVFKWAVRTIAESITKSVKSAKVSLDDIDLFILHQANIRIIDAAVNDLGIPREKIYVNLNRFGNTSAASIPLALDEANRAGMTKRGDKVLFCGFGAGLTWGSCVFQW